MIKEFIYYVYHGCLAIKEFIEYTRYDPRDDTTLRQDGWTYTETKDKIVMKNGDQTMEYKKKRWMD